MGTKLSLDDQPDMAKVKATTHLTVTCFDPLSTSHIQYDFCLEIVSRVYTYMYLEYLIFLAYGLIRN